MSAPDRVYLRRRTVVSLPVASALGISAGSAVGSAAAASSRRLLLVGDSITMGSAGDWTWRYRLDRHLKQCSAGVDLVGTRHDLYDNVHKRFGSSAYLDPAFDTAHAARWGWFAGQASAQITSIATRTRPDLYVVLLGTNDLSYGASPVAVTRTIRGLVDQARTVTPEADFVLVPPPHLYQKAERKLAGRLARLAASLDDQESRVVAAPVDGFTDADTWDGWHPNARGELKIAAAVADALAGLGVGTTYRRPLPQVALGPRKAATDVSVRARDSRAVLRFASAPGVDREHVWTRGSSRARWRHLGTALPSRAWTSPPLALGRHEFRLQPAKGHLVAAKVRSRTVAVRIT